MKEEILKLAQNTYDRCTDGKNSSYEVSLRLDVMAHMLKIISILENSTNNE